MSSSRKQPAHSQINEKEFEKQLRQLYIEEKLNMREIADRWNVSPQIISYYLNKFGVERRSRGKTPLNIMLRLSKEELQQQLQQLYVEEELTGKEIAERWKVSPNAIHRSLVEFGFETRSKGRRVLYERLGMSEEQFRQQIHCLVEKGLTTQDIADYWGANYYTISRYLKEYGVKPPRKRPVREITGRYRKCPECGEPFRRKNNRQIYCSYACRDRAKQRKYREERRRKGLCVKCGGHIDSEKARIGRPAVGIHYCRKCREYFRQRHRV